MYGGGANYDHFFISILNGSVARRDGSLFCRYEVVSVRFAVRPSPWHAQLVAESLVVHVSVRVRLSAFNEVVHFVVCFSVLLLFARVFEIRWFTFSVSALFVHLVWVRCRSGCSRELVAVVGVFVKLIVRLVRLVVISGWVATWLVV